MISTVPSFVSFISFGLLVAACDLAPQSEPVTDIYWSDGDSGRIDGERFRLADVDAPEAGPVGTERGAHCEAERQLAIDAKQFMQDLTQDAGIEVRIYETDSYGRLVIGLSANHVNVADAGLKAGHLKSWPHGSGRALTAKPDWCR